MNTIDKKVVVLLNADWHIKIQPFIIHNRWYNKVYSCVIFISIVAVAKYNDFCFRIHFVRLIDG